MKQRISARTGARTQRCATGMTGATRAPSVNERERKVFEGRRSAGRVESLESSTNQCAFHSAICASVRGSGVTGISRRVLTGA